MANMMKYTYLVDGIETTAMVDMDMVRQIKKNTGMSVKEASLRYIAYANGDMTKEECLAAPASDTKPKRKAPTRKVDVEKKALINSLFEYFQSGQVTDALSAAGCGAVDTVVVENDQRLIRFTVGDATYDLTLARKRATK